MKVSKAMSFALILIFCVITIGSIDARAEVVVYSADNEFLGILQLSFNQWAYIYIPSLERVIRINYEWGDTTGGMLWFAEEGCFANLPDGEDFYIHSNQAYDIRKVGDSYYTGERAAPVPTLIKSEMPPDGSCHPLPTDPPHPPEHWRPAVPAFEIQLPFTTPVALPLRFDHEPAHPGKWKNNEYHQ